jgi:hypothetical protein
MRKQIISFVPATIGAILSFGGLTVSGSSVRAADDCVAKPNAQAPQGGHWYYRTDRVNNRKCWYLRSDDGQVLQGAQDTSQDTDSNADDTATTGQSAPPPAAPSAPVKSEAPHRAVIESATPKAIRSQPAGSDKTATPSMQQSTGPVPVPYNASPSVSWPWPSDMKAAETAPTPSPAPTTVPTRETQMPAATSYDAPKPVVPVRVRIAPPNAQAADQPLAQASIEPTPQTPIASGVDGARARGTGGSAVEMLQKSFQRLTAPSTPGGEPDHAVALFISALALCTIGIGIFIATLWSRRDTKQDQTVARWDMANQNFTEQDFRGQDFQDQDLRHQDVRPQDVRHQDIRHQELGARDFRQHDIRHQGGGVRHSAAEDFVADATAIPHVDDRNADTGETRHLDHISAAIAAVNAVRNAKAQQVAESAPSTFLRLRRGQQPVRQEQPARPTAFQDPRYQQHQPVDARHSAAPPTAAESLSTHAVEDTLRKMLQELDAKRSGRSAEPASQVVHDLPKKPPPSPADQFGRPNRSKIRQA